MIRNLEYYRAFYYTTTLCSFSDAAAKLYVTQSAVSQAVKKLESELKCKLFERNASPIQLTEEGKSLLIHISLAFQELQLGEQELLERKELKKKKLKIGATETTLYYGVLERLKAFQKDHPDVTIQLCGSTTPELLDMLKERELEAAFLIWGTGETSFLGPRVTSGWVMPCFAILITSEFVSLFGNSPFQIMDVFFLSKK